MSQLRPELAETPSIIGQSMALKGVMSMVDRVAPTSSTVLILGESGVGKELVAKEIHHRSPRSSRRLVNVNCAAIPEELIESELFGHERGSFTGANERQVGKFEKADRGTIFLDEVGDMSLKAQAKVLRVLQEHEVERLGSGLTLNVDVRVIAATNKNLEEEIKKGRFREDLFYRLAVIPIRLPPLRERREDIPHLVRHFLDGFGHENNLPPKAISPLAINALQDANWRGNIRQLKNVVERVAITAGEVIEVSDLPCLFTPADVPAVAGDNDSNWREKIPTENEILRRYYSDLLKLYYGNKTQVARAAGVSRAKLHYLLERLGLLKDEKKQTRES